MLLKKGFFQEKNRVSAAEYRLSVKPGLLSSQAVGIGWMLKGDLHAPQA